MGVSQKKWPNQLDFGVLQTPTKQGTNGQPQGPHLQNWRSATVSIFSEHYQPLTSCNCWSPRSQDLVECRGCSIPLHCSFLAGWSWYFTSWDIQSLQWWRTNKLQPNQCWPKRNNTHHTHAVMIFCLFITGPLIPEETENPLVYMFEMSCGWVPNLFRGNHPKIRKHLSTSTNHHLEDQTINPKMDVVIYNYVYSKKCLFLVTWYTNDHVCDQNKSFFAG